MRFKQYLNESDVNFEDLKSEIEHALIPEFANTLTKNKQAFLGGQIMYRGVDIKSHQNVYTVTRGESARMPRDSTKAFHDLLDSFLAEKFGTKYRSHGVFASPSEIIANAYGKIFIFVPAGENIKYCYSKLLDDAYLQLIGSFRDTINFFLSLHNNSHEELLVVLMKYKLATEFEIRNLNRNPGIVDKPRELFRTMQEERANCLDARTTSSPYFDFIREEILPKCEYHETDSYEEAVNNVVKNGEIMVKCEKYALVRCEVNGFKNGKKAFIEVVKAL